MAATLFAATTLKEPTVTAQEEKSAIYSLQLPSSWLAAGEPWDLSDDFKYVYGMTVLGNEDVADNAWKYGMQCDPTAAASSTNTLVTAHYSKGAAGAMTVVPNADDLSTVSAMIVKVYGK